MAGPLQSASVWPPRMETPSFRRVSRLLPSSQRSFSVGKSYALPFTCKLRLVSKIRQIRASAESPQGIGDSENRLPPVLKSNWSTPLAKFAVDNFLPLALVSGVVIGFANPSLGCLADTYYLSKFSTFGIFIISGLTLRSDEIGAAMEAWPVGLFGLLAGGNSALALTITLISNLLGILIIPFSISRFVAAGVGVSVPTERLLRNLVLTLLLPLIIGKIAREVSKGVADFADGNRKLLGMINAIFLSFVPWIQVSRSRPLLLMVKPAIFLVAVILGALLHVALFAFNALLIRCLSLISGGSMSPFAKKENVHALLLVTSQKTLPVSVAVVDQLRGALGVSGLLVLPCVAAHLNQIIIDSFVVGLWKRKEGGFEKTKVA